MGGVLTLVTSIPPALTRSEGATPMPDYQERCVRSWLDNGFNVVSVNDTSEAEKITAQYPDITVRGVQRNSAQLSGKKTPFIQDMIAAGLETGSAIIGLCNSDILFEPSSFWTDVLPDSFESSAIVVQRYDVASLHGGAMRIYPHGFDSFFMSRRDAEALLRVAPPFAIGLPWWDFWIPLALAFQGLELNLQRRPTTMHLFHEQGYQWGLWRYFGKHFTQFVASAENVHDRHGGLQTVKSLCNDAIKAAPQSAEAENYWLEKIGMASVAAIQDFARNRTNLCATAPEPDNGAVSNANSDGFFHNLNERIEAGTYLDSAMLTLREGKRQDAEPLLRAVLARVPDEFDALCVLGKLYLEEKKFPAAVDLLSKAVLQRSDLYMLLDGLGEALIGTEDYAAAIPYLEKVVALAPQFAGGHHKLAVALRALGRQEDAIRHFNIASSLP